MRGNPGRIVLLPDGRKAIVYNAQPLREQGKIVVTLVDDDFQPLVDEKGNRKVLLKDIEKLKEELPSWKAIGMVD